jgi:hypothetical protein
VDWGLIVEKGRGLMKKWLEYLFFGLFSNEKTCRLGPRAVNRD